MGFFLEMLLTFIGVGLPLYFISVDEGKITILGITIPGGHMLAGVVGMGLISLLLYRLDITPLRMLFTGAFAGGLVEIIRIQKKDPARFKKWVTTGIHLILVVTLALGLLDWVGLLVF